MLTKEDFIKFIVEGSKSTVSQKNDKAEDSALPEGFDGFGFDGEETEDTATETASFARNLMEASGFGNAQYLERSEVILGDDPAAKYLPDQVYYWPQLNDRPYQTLLFELGSTGSQLLKTPLFRALRGQQILEDALSRLVQMSLKGFEQGGEKRTASVKQGRQTETLCIVSCPDDREETDNIVHLVCFGTVSADQNSLESFHIREESKYWEPQIRDDHLEKLYKRHFSKLVSGKWQNAFISGEERKLARKLLEICIEKNVKDNEKRIQESVVELFEEIAKSFGLRRKGGKGGRRLTAFVLPSDHDIGMDSEVLEKQGGENPFSGMTLRDEKNRLLGYIIYCLDEKKDAVELRNYLKANNRFNNVLVIYPDGDHAELELWQGKAPLAGKLTKKGASYQGEGEVVNLLSRFFVVSQAKIKNPAELAEELAFRARYLRKLALRQLYEENEDGELRRLFSSFKKALIHDQTEEEFADSYAQTLTYGLLSARWISKEIFSKKGERFTREKALHYFPNTSSFLKDFFSIVLNATFEFKLTWLLEDVADLLDRIDINKIFKIVEDTELANDPVIHFYEPFLASYDANLKRSRGVFYTPKPVVSYIVKNVDKALIDEFDLTDGLADTSTWGQMVKRYDQLKIPKDIQANDSFIQILDPATGTGTFLVEVIDLIHKRLIGKWQKKGLNNGQIESNWIRYVNKHLLPRLYGYEIMMASYVIAHMKIGLKLNETGYVFSDKNTVHINLTNTLEDYNESGDNLDFEIKALATEAKNVNEIKRSKFFTVVIGNPPYSGHSSNINEWISALLRKKLADGANSYFEVNGESLKERNPKWLNDDYVKFIRYSQYTIAKTGIGIFCMITNHGYLNNPTFRGMRQSLLSTFSILNVVDLHGNANRSEIPNEIQVDKNVFDIKQGVAILLGIKRLNSEKSSIYYDEIWGEREHKFDYLNNSYIKDGTLLKPTSPFYLYIYRDEGLEEEYRKGWKLTDIFPVSNVGIITKRDGLTIHKTPDKVWETVNLFSNLKSEDARVKFSLPKDVRDWKVEWAQKDLIEFGLDKKNIIPICYRPFDIRYTYYTGKSRGFIGWPFPKIMRHIIKYENIVLISARSNKSSEMTHFFCTEFVSETKCGESTTQSCVFPLLLNDDSELLSAGDNFNISDGFLKEFSNVLNITYKNREDFFKRVSGKKIFYYIYALVHSKIYRNRYQDFIKIDFPKIFIPKSEPLFETLSLIGKDLVDLHLMKLKSATQNEVTFNLINCF